MSGAGVLGNGASVRDKWGNLPAEAVRDPTASHAADDGAGVSNRQEVVGHGGAHAVLDGEQRDVVEGDEHAAVDEEEGQAKGEEAALDDGLADAAARLRRLDAVLLRRRLDAVALGVVAGGVLALGDEEAGGEEDGDGDEGDDAVHPRGGDDGEELVDDDGPEDAAHGGA